MALKRRLSAEGGVGGHLTLELVLLGDIVEPYEVRERSEAIIADFIFDAIDDRRRCNWAAAPAAACSVGGTLMEEIRRVVERVVLPSYGSIVFTISR